MMTVVVTGATGNVGGALADLLRDKPGFQVRAGSRDPGKMKASGNVQTVRTVFEEPDTFDEALAGADSLFLIAPPMDPQSHVKLPPVIDKARRAGLTHIVFNSSFGMEHVEQSPLRKVEHHLMNSGVNWTILRPNFFMENFISGFALERIRQQGGIFLAAGDGKTSFISTKDVANVARVALEEKHYGREHSLTGPEALDHGEIARSISEVSGRPVAYHPLTEEQMLQGAAKAGMPEHGVQYLAVLYKAIRDGQMSPVNDEFARITGTKPVVWGQFARENAPLWRP